MKPDVFSGARAVINEEEARATAADQASLRRICQHVRHEHDREQSERETGFQMVTHAQRYRPSRETQWVTINLPHSFGQSLNTLLFRIRYGSSSNGHEPQTGRNTR